MKAPKKIILLMLIASMLLTGCSMRTVDELFCLPKRAEVDSDLQEVMDEAMEGLAYSAPISGENQQTVQTVDLDGDGVEEHLLFAKDGSEKPLKILIFSKLAAGYVLMDTIEGYGFAFEFVDYADVDDRPGLEIIVGRQVSDQVVRAVAVYRFTSGFSRQLMTASYTKMVSADLDLDGREDLLLINPGQTEDSNASSVLYCYRNGEMRRSAEMTLSAPADVLKRVTLGKLQDGTPAVYVTAGLNENALITDVLMVKEGQVSGAAMGVTSQALDNYFVYPEDIDNDGVQELPQLLPSEPNQQYLLRWYSVDAAGQQKDKLYTYHNYNGGWYLRLADAWAENLLIEQTEDMYRFLLQQDDRTIELFTILVLSGPDREQQAMEKGRILLYSGDTVTYAATLGKETESLSINEEALKKCFRLIRMDWNTEENRGNDDEKGTDS